MRIAFDFHSVLNHLLLSLIEKYNRDHGKKHTERYGRLLSYNDCTAWDLTEYTVIGGDIYHYFAKPKTHLEAPPVPYAPEITRMLVEAGHELCVITDSIMLPTLSDYLKQYYPHIDRRDRLYRVPNAEKAQFLNGMGWDVFVEDRRENLSGFKGTPYLITTPYNAQFTDFPERQRLGPIETAMLNLGGRLGLDIDQLVGLAIDSRLAA